MMMFEFSNGLQLEIAAKRKQLLVGLKILHVHSYLLDD